MSPDALARSLFSALRLMDEEASAKWGLEDYGSFRRPELRRPLHETEWARRLCELLRHDNIAGDARSRGELRLHLPDGSRVRLELRGAWKTAWALRRSLWRYRAQLPSAAELGCLDRLTRTAADRVAFLLVGFDDTLHPMTRDVDHLAAESPLKGWSASTSTWSCLRRLGHHVRIWNWSRELS